LIDAEATAVIGAGPCKRSEDRVAVRNGTKPRVLTTTSGDLALRILKLRTGSFFPSLLERQRRIDQALFAVVMEAYRHGVSTRKVDGLVRALGADTARQTGRPGPVATVHIVAQAAGPLNGDEVAVQVHVGPGAALRVRSTAATLALPAPGVEQHGARLSVVADVGEGALLDWQPETVLLDDGADVECRTTFRLSAAGRQVAKVVLMLGRQGSLAMGRLRMSRLAPTADHPCLGHPSAAAHTHARHLAVPAVDLRIPRLATTATDRGPVTDSGDPEWRLAMCATGRPSRRAPCRAPSLIAAAGPSQHCRASRCEQVLRISPDTPLRRALPVDRLCARRSDRAGVPRGLRTVEVSDR
jgi:hypothetical protein